MFYSFLRCAENGTCLPFPKRFRASVGLVCSCGAFGTRVVGRGFVSFGGAAIALALVMSRILQTQGYQPSAWRGAWRGLARYIYRCSGYMAGYCVLGLGKQERPNVYLGNV